MESVGLMIVIMIGLMIVIMIVIMIGIMIVRAHDSSVTPSTTGCFDRAPTRQSGTLPN